MSTLEIKTYGAPVLRKKAQPLKEINGKVKEIADSMIETLRFVKGVGLAANQVGMLDQICIIDISKGEKKDSLLILINPVIVEKDGKIKLEEGCLSFPEIIGEVERYSKVNVKALDLNGRNIEIIGENLLARVLQHEIDHLNGVLFIDHLSFIKRLALEKKLNGLKKMSKRGN